MCEAYVVPFLFGSLFTVCHPYIDVATFLEMFFLLLIISINANGLVVDENTRE